VVEDRCSGEKQMTNAVTKYESRPTIVSVLKQVGFVVAAALLGIVVWALADGLTTLVRSGSFNDHSAALAGQHAARYALRIGGCVGALIGAWFNAQYPRNQAFRFPGLAGWITAGVLVLFFLVASMGAK
jgi:hypothetical protein